MTKLTKWTPTTNLMMLRRMGKLSEELAELSNVAARCIIQGIDEVDPGSGKVNRLRLEQEIADVIAQCNVTIKKLELNEDYIEQRIEDKTQQMTEWEDMFNTESEAKREVFTVDSVGSSYGNGPEKSTVIIGWTPDSKALVRGTKLYTE